MRDTGLQGESLLQKSELADSPRLQKGIRGEEAMGICRTAERVTREAANLQRGARCAGLQQGGGARESAVEGTHSGLQSRARMRVYRLVKESTRGARK